MDPKDVTIFQGPGGTGGVVTRAGIVFGLTTFALLGGDVITIVQVGSTLGVGLLIETLVVRTVLVPTIAVLLGRWFCHKQQQSRRPPICLVQFKIARAPRACWGSERRGRGIRPRSSFASGSASPGESWADMIVS
jgi:uncharacterized membrane protein YdfJ with MMPL/SSD domain